MMNISVLSREEGQNGATFEARPLMEKRCEMQKEQRMIFIGSEKTHGCLRTVCEEAGFPRNVGLCSYCKRT